MFHQSYLQKINYQNHLLLKFDLQSLLLLALSAGPLLQQFRARRAHSKAITTPANQRSATLDGWELNLQHMFGKSGFGMQANLTLVNSDLKYDNANRGEQFALEGLSDSANLVLFYENAKWQVRGAYNWRDKFLSGRFDGSGLPNPVYTEAYGQLDVNVSYQWNDNLTLQAEVINLNDGIQRLHGRTKEQVLFVTQTGPRYMLGARYKF